MKSFLKIAAWVGGIIVALIIVAVVALKIFFPVEKARQMAVEKGTAMLGRPVQIESLDVSVWGGIGLKLNKVSIGNQAGFDQTDQFLAAEHIELKLRLLPLLSKRVEVSKLIIERPTIAMIKTKDGANNYTFPKADSAAPEVAQSLPAEAKPAAVTISFDEVSINGGSVRYVDDSGGMSIRAVNLGMKTSVDNPRAGLYQSKGKLTIDTLLVVTDEPMRPLAVGLDYDAGFDMTAKLLSIGKGDLDVNGLKFNVTGLVHMPDSHMTANVNVKSDQIRAVDLFNLMSDKQRQMIADFTINGDFALNADVMYADTTEPATLGYSGNATITNLTMAKKGLDGDLNIGKAMVDFETDRVRVVIEDGSFNNEPLKGQLIVEDFANPRIQGQLAGSLDLVFLQPFLPAQSEHQVTGKSRFDVKFNGVMKDVANLDFSGTIAIDSGTYRSKVVPEPIEAFSIDAYFDRKLVNLRQFAARFPSGNISFIGRIDNLVPYMMADSTQAAAVPLAIDGAIAGNMKLGMLQPLLPKKGGPQLNGDIAVDMKLAGTVTDPQGFKPRGTITIANASYTDSLLPEPITNFSTKMTISPDTIGIDGMKVKFVSSDAEFDGKLADPFPYLLPLSKIDRSNMKKPMFVFTLKSHRFDADKLFPEVVPGSEEAAAQPVDSVSMVMLPDIDGRGTFSCETMIYSKVEFTNIVGKMKIANRKIECYDATGKVYTGSVAGTSTIDLNNLERPTYAGEFTASQIEANDFISRFSKFGGFVYGKLDLKGNYAAAGTEPDVFLKSLSMNGDGGVSSGKLMASGQLFSLLQGLAEKSGKKFDAEQPLRSLSTLIRIEDGKVKLNNLKMTLANIGDVEIGGYYGFDGGLQYTGTVLLTQELSQSLIGKGGLVGSLAGALSNKQTQRIPLPITVAGTMTSPAFKIDYNAAAAKVGESLKESTKDKVQNLLEGLKKKP